MEMKKRESNQQNKIMTIIGEFEVRTSYPIFADDKVLLNLLEAFNRYALKFLPSGFDDRNSDMVNQVINHMSEADLEEVLFNANRAGEGSAPRLTLSIKKRLIEFQSF
jgi:hypothetical protein